MNKIITTIFIIILGYSCQPPVNYGNDIPGLLQELKNNDTAIRFDALRRLQYMRLSEDESLQLIDAATQKFPSAEYEWQSIPGILIDNATEYESEKYIAPIEHNFSKYDTAAKTEALYFLAGYADATSIETYTRLLIKYQDYFDVFPQGILKDEHKYRNIIFPKLMELAGHRHIGADIQLLLLEYLKKKSVNPAGYTVYLPQLYAQCDSLYAKIFAKQESFTEMNDMWDDEDYGSWRYHAGVTLDLLGYIPHEDSKKILRTWLKLQDSKLQMFAAISLIRQGETVDRLYLLKIAADAESRNHLYNSLEEMSRKDLFPAHYLNQAAFAESDMVEWLLYPTELGRMPDKIELMKVVTRNEKDDGEVEYYLFRFRSDHADWIKDGWMTGMSGSFSVDDKPTTVANGSTFSSFESWEEKTVDEHIKDYLDSED